MILKVFVIYIAKIDAVMMQILVRVKHTSLICPNFKNSTYEFNNAHPYNDS